MRAVKRVQPTPQQGYKKQQDSIQQAPPTAPPSLAGLQPSRPPAFGARPFDTSLEEDSPLDHKEKKDEKPEQIVHPIQYIKEQQQQQQHHQQQQQHFPHMLQHETLPGSIYRPSMADKDTIGGGPRPGIIPMSKIGDHSMFNSQQHITNYTSATPQHSSLFAARTLGPINMSSLHFPRSQTPVSSYNNSTLGTLSTGSFNQNNLSTSFNSSGQFIPQVSMTNQDQILSFAALQQNPHPFGQMMLQQNYQIGGLELMPQLHSTQALNSPQFLQNSLPEHFSGVTGSHAYPALRFPKAKPFGR